MIGGLPFSWRSRFIRSQSLSMKIRWRRLAIRFRNGFIGRQVTWSASTSTPRLCGGDSLPLSILGETGGEVDGNVRIWEELSCVLNVLQPLVRRDPTPWIFDHQLLRLLLSVAEAMKPCFRISHWDFHAEDFLGWLIHNHRAACGRRWRFG